MRRDLWPIAILLLLIVAAKLFFDACPQVDMGIASYFYDAQAQRFSPRTFGLWLTVKRAIYVFNDGWIPALIIGNLLLLCGRRPAWLQGKQAQWLFLLAALTLGPGAGVGIAKDYFHRPRPVAVVQFGGQEAYVAPLARGTQKHDNGFYSGHAAMGFYFASLAFLERRRRVVRYMAGILAGGFIGYSRMALGGHFLSDVLFSGLFTLLIIHLLYSCCFRRYLAVPAGQ